MGEGEKDGGRRAERKMEGEGGAEDGGEGERAAQPASVVQVKSTQQGVLALSPLRLPHCPTPSQAVGLRFCGCR